MTLVQLPVDFGEKDDLIAVAGNITEKAVQVVEQIVVADKRLCRTLLDPSG
jgi:hypothetical protein